MICDLILDHMEGHVMRFFAIHENQITRSNGRRYSAYDENATNYLKPILYCSAQDTINFD